MPFCTVSNSPVLLFHPMRLMMVRNPLPVLVECAKTKAYADHQYKEILIMMGKMHCVIQFLEWKPMWWFQLSFACSDAPIDAQHGLATYVAKQSVIWCSMATFFTVQWYPNLIKNQIPVQVASTICSQTFCYGH